MANTLLDLGKATKAEYPGQFDDLDDLTLGRSLKAEYPDQFTDFNDAPAAPSYKTALAPTDAAGFQAWKTKNAPNDSGEDYDLQGAYLADKAGKLPRDERGHTTDAFKMPNHPTFSTESQYNGKNGNIGGRWEESGGKTRFYASPTNLQHYTPAELRQYFSKNEPGVELILPPAGAEQTGVPGVPRPGLPAGLQGKPSVPDTGGPIGDIKDSWEAVKRVGQSVVDANPFTGYKMASPGGLKPTYMDKPIVDLGAALPTREQMADVTTSEPVRMGVEATRAGLDLVSGLGTPTNIGIGLATGGAGEIATALKVSAPMAARALRMGQRALSVYFAGTMGRDAAETVPKALEAYRKGDLVGAASEIVRAAGAAGFGTLAAVHAATPHAEPTIAPRETSAEEGLYDAEPSPALPPAPPADPIAHLDSQAAEASARLDRLRPGPGQTMQEPAVNMHPAAETIHPEPASILAPPQTPEKVPDIISPEGKTDGGQATGLHPGTVGEGEPFRAANPKPLEIPGPETEILIPGRTGRYKARYAIRELDDVNASHNGNTFEPNDRYTIENERNYKDPANQQRVIEDASPGVFNPRFLITDNPDVTNGPPAIDEQGNVVGGNSRIMKLQRAFESNPGGVAEYRALLEAKATQFGIDPATLHGMKRPVLVREIPESTFDDVTRQELVRATNVSGTADLTPAERTLAAARSLTPGAADSITQALEDAGEDATISAVLDGKRGAELINKLIDEGVFSQQQRPRLMDGRTGAVTAEGKRLVEEMLTGQVYRNSDQIQRTPPAIRGKVERIAPVLTRFKDTEWDILPDTQKAIDVLEEARSHGIKNLDDLSNQANMFGGLDYSPDQMAIAKLLQGKPNDVVRAFRRYAANTESNPMFGRMTRAEAFEDAFPSNRVEKGVVAEKSTGEVTEHKHEFSSTQVNLPADVGAKVLAEAAKIPDNVLTEDGRETEPHVTIKYGLHGDALEAVRKLLSTEPPVKARLGATSLFENEDGDVVKADVDSPDLHALNKKIADAIAHTDTHPEFKPHVTLAYVKPGEGKAFAGNETLKGQEFTVDHIVLSDRDGNKTDIPLRGEASNKIDKTAAASNKVDTPQRRNALKKLAGAGAEADKRLRKRLSTSSSMNEFLNPETIRDLAVSLAGDVARGVLKLEDVGARLVKEYGPNARAAADQVVAELLKVLGEVGLKVKDYNPPPVIRGTRTLEQTPLIPVEKSPGGGSVSPSYDQTRPNLLNKVSEQTRKAVEKSLDDFEERNPERKIVSFDEIRQEARELGLEAVMELDPAKLKKGETLNPALRFAAREALPGLQERISELDDQLKDPDMDPVALEEMRQERGQLEADARRLTDVLVMTRSQDGRNLAYHAMMAKLSFDPAHWIGKAKRSMGLPADATLPGDVRKEIEQLTAAGQKAETKAIRRVRKIDTKQADSAGGGNNITGTGEPGTPRRARRKLRGFAFKGAGEITAKLEDLESRMKARIAQRYKSAGSTTSAGVGLAAEQLADYAAVGAIKIAKGAVSFADWSAAMAGDFGDELKPHLETIFAKAQEVHRDELLPMIEEESQAAEKPVKNRLDIVREKHDRLVSALERSIASAETAKVEPVSPAEREAWEKEPEILKLRSKLERTLKEKKEAAGVPQPSRKDLIETALRRRITTLQSQVADAFKTTVEAISPEERAAFDQNPDVKRLTEALERARKEKRDARPGISREELAQRALNQKIASLKAQIGRERTSTVEAIKPQERVDFDKDPEVQRLRGELAAIRKSKRDAAPAPGLEKILQRRRAAFLARLRARAAGKPVSIEAVSAEQKKLWESDPEVLSLRAKIAAEPRPVVPPPDAADRMARYKTRSLGKIQDQMAGATKTRTPSKWELSATERAEVDADPEVRAARIALARRMMTLEKTGNLDAIAALRRAGLLTGVKTHLRNIVGTTGFQGLEEASRIPGVMVDAAMSVATGQRTLQGPNLRAMAGSGREALLGRGPREAMEIMREGATQEQLAQMDSVKEVNTGNRVFDTAVNSVFRSMAAEDRIQKVYAFERSIREQMALAKVDAPTNAMRLRAIEDANFATFNNRNMAATAWSGAKSWLKRHGPAGKGTAFAMDVLVPFANTPANILSRLIDYTPVGGVGRAGFALHKAMQSKGWTPENQRAFSQAIGRGATGSALMVLGWWLGSKGLLTGVSDEDKGKRAVAEAAGRMPGSILIGGKWRRIDSLSPEANILVLGATMQRDNANGVASIAAIAGKTVLEQPMLQGVGDAIDAIRDPGRRANYFAGSMAGSFVPTIVSDVASVGDNVRRDAKGKGMWDSAARGVMARTPWLRNQLPARHDVFGNEMPQSKWGAVDPTLSSEAKELTDPVLKEMIRVGASMSPARPRANESDFDLERRQVRAGDRVHSELEKLMRSSDYRRADDDEKADLIEAKIKHERNADTRANRPRASAAR